MISKPTTKLTTPGFKSLHVYVHVPSTSLDRAPSYGWNMIDETTATVLHRFKRKQAQSHLLLHQSNTEQPITSPKGGGDSWVITWTEILKTFIVTENNILHQSAGESISFHHTEKSLTKPLILELAPPFRSLGTDKRRDLRVTSCLWHKLRLGTDTPLRYKQVRQTVEKSTDMQWQAMWWEHSDANILSREDIGPFELLRMLHTNRSLEVFSLWGC